MTSDEELQELRRQADAGGVEERTRLLEALVRDGWLDEHRLRMAAFLGDEASRAWARSQPRPSDGGEHFPTPPEWNDGLSASAWGSVMVQQCPLAASRPFMARVLVAAGRRVLDSLSDDWSDHQLAAQDIVRYFRGRRPDEGIKAATMALEHADDWIACPCQAHADAAHGAGLVRLKDGAKWSHGAGFVAGYPRRSRVVRAGGKPMPSPERDADEPEVYDEFSRTLAECDHAASGVTEAILAEVVPWLIGDRDAPALRAASRGLKRTL